MIKKYVLSLPLVGYNKPAHVYSYMFVWFSCYDSLCRTGVADPDAVEIYTVCLYVFFAMIHYVGFADPDTVDPKLVCNFTDVAFSCFPDSFKRKFGCGFIDLNEGEDSVSM